MKKIITLFVFVFAIALHAQQDTSKTNYASPQFSKPRKTMSNRFYYGGGIGASFSSNYWAVSLRPMFGYKLTQKFSLGMEIMYEYVSDSRYHNTYNYSNYGGSVFARYRVIPSLYFHAEYATYNYDYYTAYNNGEREWIPFLLVGAGYSQRIGRNTYTYAQVLWDVLQDDRSPYRSGEPWVTFGISYGF
jgi:hypothetical protein